MWHYNMKLLSCKTKSQFYDKLRMFPEVHVMSLGYARNGGQKEKGIHSYIKSCTVTNGLVY